MKLGKIKKFCKEAHKQHLEKNDELLFLTKDFCFLYLNDYIIIKKEYNTKPLNGK